MVIICYNKCSIGDMNMTINEIIAKNISDLLTKAKKKQQDLADALNMPKQTISKMLNGVRMISAPELCQIAKYFNVSMDALVKEKEDVIYSPIKAFMGEVKTQEGKEGVEIAEALMDLYSFHHKFQSKEFVSYSNQVWSDE